MQNHAKSPLFFIFAVQNKRETQPGTFRAFRISLLERNISKKLIDPVR
jgi:hypothetical protein